MVAAPAAQAQVQVHVDIGFHLPAPPRLVVVPQVPAVQYVPEPAAPGNLFFYGGQYWAFAGGGWYVSGGYNGPWVVVGPQFVPRPVLFVPVQYYHVPPGHWKKWERARGPALAGGVGPGVGRQARLEGATATGAGTTTIIRATGRGEGQGKGARQGLRPSRAGVYVLQQDAVARLDGEEDRLALGHRVRRDLADHEGAAAPSPRGTG